jgi:hypothetical protein
LTGASDGKWHVALVPDVEPLAVQGNTQGFASWEAMYAHAKARSDEYHQAVKKHLEKFQLWVRTGGARGGLGALLVLAPPAPSCVCLLVADASVFLVAPPPPTQGADITRQGGKDGKAKAKPKDKDADDDDDNANTYASQPASQQGLP